MEKYEILKTKAQVPTSPTKIKPIFKQSAVWRCFVSSDVTHISKYKPRMLSKISIQCLNPENIGIKNLWALKKTLSTSKRASSMTIDVSNSSSKQLRFLIDSTNHWSKISFQSSTNPSNFQDLQRKELRSCIRIGKCKKLSALPFTISSMKFVDSRISNRLCKQIQQLNQLKSLQLEIPFSSRSSFFNRKSLQSLQHLSLAFRENPSSLEEEFSKLILGLEQCRHLERLDLNFFSRYKIGTVDSEIWTSFFQNTPSALKKLSLFLFFHDEQEPIPLKSFIASFKSLEHLTSLNFTLTDYFISNRSSAFLEGVWTLLFTNFQTQLQELQMRLEINSLLKNTSVKSLALALQSLKNLKKLDVDLPFLKSPDEGLILLSKSLKVFERLEALHMRLTDTNLSKESLEIFSKSIIHHKLTSLSLSSADQTWKCFYSPVPSRVRRFACLWKTSTPAPFFFDIGKFTLLRNLNLQLLPSRISTQEWKQLSSTLKRLSNLSSLSLTLPKFDSANNFGSLLSCLKDLPKLTCLNLDFIQEIRDREVGVLASHLSGCQNLISLALKFLEPDKLGDSSLHFLLIEIRRMRALEELTLLFWKDMSYTAEGGPFGDEAISELVKGLIVRKTLRSLDFSQKMTKNTRRLLANAQLPPNLQAHQNQRHLMLLVVNDTRFI